jgi:hypothetical protein
MTHSKGMSALTSTLWGLPFTVRAIMVLSSGRFRSDRCETSIIAPWG